MKRITIILFSVIIFLISAPLSGVWASSAQLKKDFASNTDNYIRTVTLYNFLDKYHSPLKNYTRYFIDEADRYNLDWRLLVAISGVESTFGQEIPYNSYNAWGWGIYGNNTLRFSSYPEAIAVISKSLREDYINSWGAKNIYQIGRFYAASPTWASRVVYLMEKVEPSSLPLSL